MAKDLDSIFTAPAKKNQQFGIDEVDFEVLRSQSDVNFNFGITLLDLLLGGGLKGGRMTEIFGKNKSGKTELCRCLSENWINSHSESRVWYFDQEYALSHTTLEKYPAFSKKDKAGVDRFRVFNAETMEGFFEIVYNVLQTACDAGITNLPLLIVVDSVPALKAANDMAEEDLTKARMPRQAQVLSALLPKLRRLLAKTGAHAIMVNQTRKDMKAQSFVEDESPCGEALKFYADYRLITKNIGKFSFSKGKQASPEFKPMGFFTKLIIKKNKLSIPDREVEIPITYLPASGFPAGASDVWCLFYNFRDKDIISTKAGKFSFNGVSFDRKDWPAMYREFFKDGALRSDSPLLKAADNWLSQQHVVDSKDGDDDDDDGD